MQTSDAIKKMIENTIKKQKEDKEKQKIFEEKKEQNQLRYSIKRNQIDQEKQIKEENEKIKNEELMRKTEEKEKQKK